MPVRIQPQAMPGGYGAFQKEALKKKKAVKPSAGLKFTPMKVEKSEGAARKRTNMEEFIYQRNTGKTSRNSGRR